MGAVLRAYRFDRYRTKEKPEDKPKLASLTVLCADPAAAAAAWAPLDAVADGVFLARDLASEPPNVLFPAEMANRCLALEALGVKVEVFGPKEMDKLGFGMLMGVSLGSATEPRMVVMRWNGASGGKGRGKKGAPKAKPLAFIGKGVTFDTGGISIKSAGGMEDMKWDMAGAGAVIGAMAALAGRKARVDVVGLVGLVENMPVRHGAAARRRRHQLFRPDGRDHQHRRRRPPRAGRRALVLPGAVPAGLHGGPGDAHRRHHHQRSATNTPGCSPTTTRSRRSCRPPARPGARSCGACRWATPTTR